MVKRKWKLVDDFGYSKIYVKEGTDIQLQIVKATKNSISEYGTDLYLPKKYGDKEWIVRKVLAFGDDWKIYWTKRFSSESRAIKFARNWMKKH